MKGWLPLALGAAAVVAFLTYGSLIGPRSGARLEGSAQADFGSGLVDTVADGDTIHVADGRSIRLVQIDAPELATEECYAEAARHALEGLAPLGSGITLHPDPRLDARDRFGRVLAYVFKGGSNLNLRMVELGAAAPYFFHGRRGRYADVLVNAAFDARAARRGLWGACPGAQLDPVHALDTGRSRPTEHP